MMKVVSSDTAVFSYNLNTAVLAYFKNFFFKILLYTDFIFETFNSAFFMTVQRSENTEN